MTVTRIDRDEYDHDCESVMLRNGYVTSLGLAIMMMAHCDRQSRNKTVTVWTCDIEVVFIAQIPAHDWSSVL